MSASIFYRQDRKKWCIKILLESGKTKIFYGNSKSEVLEKVCNFNREEEEKKVYLDEFADKWYSMNRNQWKESTAYGYEAIVRVHIKPYFIGKDIKNLDVMDIQEFYRTKMDTGLSAKTVTNVHFVLSGIFRAAKEWEILEKNIMEKIRKPKCWTQEMGTWEIEDIWKFLEVAKNDRYYALYVTVIGTGMRKGEALGLKWEDLNLNRGELTIRRECLEIGSKFVIDTPKGEKSYRTVTLPSFVVEVLQEHKKEQFEKGFNEFIFTNSKGGHIRKSFYYRNFKKCIELAGVPDIRFHDLRHTHATLLLKENLSIKIIQERLGISCSNLILDTYGHVTPSMKRITAQAMEQIFSGDKED